MADMPLVTSTPMALKIDRRDFTNRVTTSVPMSQDVVARFEQMRAIPHHAARRA